MSRHYRPQPEISTGYTSGRQSASAYSRSSYPSFLSFQDTAFLHLHAASRGIVDAFRWDTVVRLVSSDSEIRSNVFKSLLLNSLSLISIYFFDLLLLPLVQGRQNWFHRNVGWFYQVLWLLPVVGVSLYLNSSWCTLIAKRTFTLQHGSRAAATVPSTYTGILNSIATSAYRIIMVFTSVVVSFSLRFVPIVGPSLGFIFLCWVDSYYCFEFIWIARGHSLSRRLRHLEERWAYYFAFGLPSAALCTWGSSLANAAFFALVFPAYIIMAMHARPIPLDPYNPAGEDNIRHPSPFIPIRIPIFLPVTWLNDMIIRIISIGTQAGGASNRTAAAMSSVRHQRTPSDGVESVEEGEAIQMDTTGSGNILASPKPPSSAMYPSGSKARIRMSGRGFLDRRKLD